MGTDALRFPNALIFVKESLIEKEMSAYQWNCCKRKLCLSGVGALGIGGGNRRKLIPPNRNYVVIQEDRIYSEEP